MTTKEQLKAARVDDYYAYTNYIKTTKDAVREHRGFYLKDDDSDEEGQPVRIHASNFDHNYEYFPSFDQVNVLTQNPDGTERDRIVFIFHVVDGDDLFPDNAWVSEDDFSDDRWSELLDYIGWDI